jgi:hypothetical protein
VQRLKIFSFLIICFPKFVAPSIVSLSNFMPHPCCVRAEFSLSVQFSGLLNRWLLGIDTAKEHSRGIGYAYGSGPDRYLRERAPSADFTT